MRNVNAKQELLSVLANSGKDVSLFDFAILRVGSTWSEKEDIKIIRFRVLEFLDIEYDNDFGSQNILIKGLVYENNL